MKRLSRWMAIAVVSGGAIAGCQPTVDQAKAQLCSAIAGYDQAITALQAIPGGASVNQLKEAQKSVGSAAQQVNDAAEKYQKAEVREVKDSYQQLERKVKSIPSNATLAQAQQSILPDIQNLKAALQQMRTQVQCP